ncbi:hypothetical protein EV359DRAFT_62372 [Lentinula novae-zelandiae]|nr:hypothetical protein EV359DRAFT_62372 [Lentinula novae-zelandiae]
MDPISSTTFIQAYSSDRTLLSNFVVSFVQPIDSEACRILYNISGFVLTARTWALWGKDIRLTIGLPVFFLCCWVPNFYIMHRFLRSQTFLPSPLPQEIGCVILGGQPVLYLCWVLLTIYEAVRTGRWLTRVVYRDGITYYIIIFLWSVVNVVAILLLPQSNSAHAKQISQVFDNEVASHCGDPGTCNFRAR